MNESKFIVGASPADLSAKVTAVLANGYQPVGPITYYEKNLVQWVVVNGDDIQSYEARVDANPARLIASIEDAGQFVCGMPINLGGQYVLAGVTGTRASGSDYTATQVSATAISPGSATDVQGILAELAARIDDLEGP